MQPRTALGHRRDLPVRRHRFPLRRWRPKLVTGTEPDLVTLPVRDGDDGVEAGSKAAFREGLTNRK
jgi:hypothetical protein